jgi:hypothetical protein
MLRRILGYFRRSAIEAAGDRLAGICMSGAATRLRERPASIG